jgi:arginyl-tRNA synthetase
MPDEERLAFLTEYGLQAKLEDIKRDLQSFGVRFDIWFAERRLHEQHEIDKAVGRLTERGFVYEQDGALWLKSTHFGDDKDRVVIRNNGIPTYLAADLAYHYDKYTRGYDRVIDVWAPTTTGTFPA